MPQLINVAKTDTFEEQRTKINNLAADVYNLQTQSGATAFVALTDTPSTFTADKWIRVDSAGSSLEWFDGITKLSELTNDVGYLTSFTETDPTVPGHVKSITTQNIADWNEAHGWGDHSQAGYLTTDSDTTYTIDLIQSGNTPVADEFKLVLSESTGGTDVISFKAGTGIEFEGLNANGGSEITIKSTGGGGGATTLAALTDTTIPGTITTGHVLKWDGTTWGPAPDSTSTSGSGIALTDISVVKPNPAASGNGDLTYNDVSGQFTFTPADVPSNLSQLNNDVGFITGYTETDPTVPSHVKGITAQQVTNWDEAHGWGDHSTEGYLKGIGSLSIGALSDVDTTGVANNKILKHNGTSWVIADDNAGSGGTTINSLGDINDVSINNVQGDQLLKWDGNNWINFTSGYLTSFTETDPTVPAHVKSISSADIGNWNDAYGWGDHSTAGYLTTESDPTVPSHVKGITTGDINSWNAKSDVSALNDLSDVNTGGAANGKILKHNGTSWVIGDDNTINTLNDIGDVNVGTTITDGYVLKWDNTNTQWVAAEDLTGSATSSNTYVTYLNGEPRWSEQTAANNYQEPITYQSASTTGPGGVSLLPLCDGNDNTFVNMGCGHADMSYLWLSQAALTDVVKITVGFDGHGWIGYGSNSGISIDSATMLRVDNGQAYGANGVTGSPTEIIVEDNTSNNSPIYSGQLQTLTFVEYPDANGTGGSNRGAGSRCHVYYFKITRLLDNVLTEITYNFTSGGVASSAVIEYIGYGVAGNINPSDYLYDFLDQSYDDFTAIMPTGSPWVWNNFGGKISPWNLRNDWTPSFFRLSDLSETTWSIKVHPDSVQSGFNSTIDTLDVWRSSNGTDWQFVTSSGSYTGSTVYNITAAWIMITNYGNNQHEVKVTSSSVSGGGIALTDLSVLKPNPAASGNGDLTYSSINGQFTYTPPDLSGIPNASKISQWDTAYGWGDHSAAGYLTSFTETDPTVPSHVKGITQANINTWNSALTSYTETDPVFVASAAYNINSSHITNWDTAYGWGDHSTEGYLTSYTETDPTVPSHVKNITAQDITNWNNAGSSGITLAEARQGLSINGTNGSATATGGISYDDSTGIFTYSPPDLSGIPNSSKTAQWDTAYGWGDHSTAGYLTSFTETDPTVPSHVKNITAQNISDWNSSTNIDLSNYAKISDNTNITFNRTGASSYFIINTDSYLDINTGAQCTFDVTNQVSFDVGAQFTVDAVGQIQLQSDSYFETKSTHSDFKNVAGNSTYARIDSVGLNLFTGGIIDKNNSTGTPGQILSSTSGGLDWIDAPSGGGGGISLTDISVASPHPAASGNGDLSYNASNGEFTYTPANVPTNVSQLTNDSGFLTSESDPVFSSHAASNVTTTKISNWDTAHGWGDHSQAGYLTSAPSSGVPSGTIVMYNSSSAPNGWVLCDNSTAAQNAGAPDLRGRFIVGAGGSISGSGGSADAVVVSHNHGYSSFSSVGDHTHGVSQGSTNVSNQSNHTHPAGNYAVSNASGGSHSHSVDFDTDEGGSHTHHANISGTTGNQSANHTHTMDTSGSGFGGGGHAHSQDARAPYYSSEDSETGWGYSTSWSVGARSFGGSSGNHSHSLTHATLGISENHTHSLNWNVLTSPPLTYSYHDHGLSGNTSSENTGSHNHPFSGSSGGGGSHSHNITMSFSETSTGAHTHSFSIDSEGQSGSGKNLPPYYTLTYIMKL